jgi:outer membrane protein assembly factor BamB
MRGGIVCILVAILLLASSITFLAGNIEAEDNDLESENIWPMLGGDPQHTGQSQYGASNNHGGKVWQVTKIYGFPSVSIDSDGTIYAGCYRPSYRTYSFMAINPNGTLKWTFDSGDNVQTCPAIADDGSIYFGCDDGNLYALNPNGTEKWKFATGDNIDSSPIFDQQGLIYFCTRDGRLLCMSPEGNELWNYSTDSTNYMTPALNHEGEAVFGSGGGVLYCVYPNGTLKWSSEVGTSIHGSISIDDGGNIYCIDRETNHLHSFDSDGNWRWSYFLVDRSSAGVAIGKDNTVYCGRGLDLIALDINGSLLWTFSTQGMVGVPVISSDGTIFFGSLDGNVYALDQSGKERWRYESGSGVWAQPAIGSDGTVYIANSGEELFAINGYPDASLGLAVIASLAIIVGVILAIWVVYPQKKN